MPCAREVICDLPNEYGLLVIDLISERGWLVMAQIIDEQVIASFNQALDQHPVYEAVQTLEDLQVFMQHHVYSVWDFMSLIKYLQSVVAPTSYPWLPQGDSEVRRFINELVLEEESDETHDGRFSSHLELYLQAMQEVGADTKLFESFLQVVQEQGIEAGLSLASVPKASSQFTQQTFAFIQSNDPHQVAAALALGREHIIPRIFRSILKNIGVTEEQAPIFHFYLNRHIGLDEDFHAPLSLRLLNSLCAGDSYKIQQALQAADDAVQARLKFWDGVSVALK